MDSGDHYQVLVDTELVIEAEIFYYRKISEVYCEINGQMYFMDRTKPGFYACRKFMGISGSDYGIHIIIRDIYGNEYWSSWYEVTVVEEIIEPTETTEPTETGTREDSSPTLGGVPEFEIAILITAVLILSLIHRKKQ